jgi:hypothetical protein
VRPLDEPVPEVLPVATMEVVPELPVVV